MKRSLFAITLGALTVSLGSPASAADFYVDPATGSAANDGSAAKPWKTLEEVITAKLFGTTVKAGDTVHLKSGYHGEMAVSGGSYAPPITVVSDVGLGAKLRHVRFTSTSGWVLRGVSVSPSYGTAAGAITMIEVQTNASKITVEDSEAFSVADSKAWGVSEWLQSASNGISVRGSDSTARNNKVKNVRFGITADASKVVIEGNTVENFSADGLRGLGDDETFQYNLIKNSYLDDSVDTNHDDGFQSWSVGPGGVGTGEVKNMVLRGNVIINAENPAQPLKGTLQGIGCFDGTFVGWVVENNVVITNHWHGISLYGARDSRIVNNTVIDNEAGKPGPPWILVTKHKDGTPSQNVVVRNNLTTDLDVSGTNVVEDHNVVLGANLANYFVNAASWDLHLLKTSPAVDQGSTDQAPALDADKIPRPQGAGIDLGAYEWHDSTVVPVGGTGGGGTGGGSSVGGAAGGGSGGTASGGASGSAGNPSGGSGATASGGGGKAGAGNSGGTGGAGKSSDGGDDGGCGCRLAGQDGESQLPLWLLGALLGASALLRGRGCGRRSRSTS